MVNLSLSGLDRATAEELAWLENRVASSRSLAVDQRRRGRWQQRWSRRIPGAVPSGVFAVGASDADRRAMCRSPIAEQALDLTALGCGVELSWPGGGVGQAVGRRTATPVVAGVLSALRAYRPDLSAGAGGGLAARTSASGDVERRRRAFRAAGLGWLIRGAPTAAVTRGRSSRRDAIPLASAVAETHWRSSEFGCPRVARLAFAITSLDIRMAGVPDFARAIFRVDGRSYVRALRAFCGFDSAAHHGE